MIIGIDVDLTVIDPVLGDKNSDWFSWLVSRANCWTQGKDFHKDLRDGCCDYNISSYFDLKSNVDPLDFWRQENLYDNLKPYNDAIEVINKLTEEHQVVFVSMCKGLHYKSKFYMLKKYFPQMAGFLSTHEKNFVNMDILVDDRHEFLNSVNCGRIKLNTPYTQKHELKVDAKCVDNWNEIGKLF